MRFLHTADWHLGKRLHDFSLFEVQKEALERIVAIVERERPDAVVVAGDVFDTQVPQLGALELWESAVDAIVGQAAVPMVVIPGNHDHAERLALHSNLARRAGLHIIKGLRDALMPVQLGGVHFFGVPFHKPVHVNSAWRDDSPAIGDFDYGAAMSHVLARIGRPRGPAVLVGHAFVAGSGEEGEGEDAIQVGGAGGVSASCFEGFDYVALGHIHGCRKLGAGGEVHYSGSPLKYSFDESKHAKSVTMVEIDPSGAVSSQRFPIAVSRDVRVIEGSAFDEVLAEARSIPQERRGDYLLVRVIDRDPIDRALSRLREAYPNALLEQPAIEIRDRAPRLDGDYRAIGVEDAFGQFYRHVYGEEIGGLERELLLAVLHGEDDEGEPEDLRDLLGAEAEAVPAEDERSTAEGEDDAAEEEVSSVATEEVGA